MDFAHSIKDWLIEIRRDFHQHPELGYEEFRTSTQIQTYLNQLQIPYQVKLNTGVIADIEGEDSSITIALRADIDALPIQDQKSVPYRSTIDGQMHACGHDVHTTILLGVARYFAKTKPPCSLRLIFQPAEETDGGAELLIQEGALERVDGILGLHVAAEYPCGQIAIKYGHVNAASDMITIDLYGRSGHGAYPKGSVDAIVLAGAVINNLQTIISRNIDGRESAVLTLGSIQGGTARNVIADHVRIEGTIRTLDPEVRELINARVQEMVEHTAISFGGRGVYTRKHGYTALINHDDVVDMIKQVGTDVLGEDNVVIKKLPNMGVEDFAYYLEQVKGAFYYLGVANSARGITSSVHTPTFDIDEEALVIGVNLQIANVIKFYRHLRKTQ